jgi:SAM-dependent methyltransferase
VSASADAEGSVPVEEKIAANQANWDERAAVHVGSDFYDVEGFKAGQNALRPFEIDEVGPVDGLDLVHLQCHFGLDTLTWARLGARVAGLDFSPNAVEAARGIASELGIDAEFVCADVYDAVEALGGRQFDVVYTGLGALCWLPDIDRWAAVVDALARPGGLVYVPEFHPIDGVFGDEELVVKHPYFGDPDGGCFDEPTTYGDPDAVLSASTIWDWNHPVSQVLTALLERGLVLESFHEFPFTLFQRWPFLVRHDDGTYRMPEGMPSLPLVYSLKLRKPA